MNFFLASEIRNCLYLFSTSKRAQAKYAAMTTFDAKWKYESLFVVGRIPHTTQNLVFNQKDPPKLPEDEKTSPFRRRPTATAI